MGRPLPFRDFAQLPLTVAIYWRKRTGIDSLQNGHAALVLDTSHFLVTSEADYVSWLGSGAGGNGVTSFSAAPHSYVADAGQWGGQAVPGGDFHVPTRWVAIEGLNIDEMRGAWNEARTKERAHWKLFDKNCATMVARILKAGGGDNFSRGGVKHQKWWWPMDIMKYGRSMGTHVYATSSDD